MSLRKTHRDLPDIPTDPAERRKQIKWVMDHPLWTHSHFIPVPPEGVDIFVPIEGKPNHCTFADSSDWPIKDVGDGCFTTAVDIAVVFVDPTTERIEDDDNRNTDLRVWIEAGGWIDLSSDPESYCGGNIPEGGWTEHNKWSGSHDHRLDCGGPTIDDALLELARLVKFFYEDDGKDRKAPVACDGWFEGETYHHGHTDDGNGYCSKCGFEIQEGDGW